jgi:hypothetical protein
MKKSALLILFTGLLIIGKSQINQLDFGTSNGYFICNPPIYTTTGQSQCISLNPVVTLDGNTVMYYTTSAGSTGADCRNWLRLSNPGFLFIGTGSELQLRNAGNGSTINNPARFLVRDFTPGLRFGITFDAALVGEGGAFYFRCGSGQAYGDTMYMISRDSSSFMVMKFDATNPAIHQPYLRYSNSNNNPTWPNVPSYFWTSGINSNFSIYQKHTVAIFCNNTNTATSYSYIGNKLLNPQSYDVYLDSVLDVDNMYDNFFGAERGINSFMFCGSDATCANGGQYLGDTIIVDNVRWTTDFTIYSLPITLSLFTAKLSSSNSVYLTWTDQTPSDHNLFEVQMSRDGINFFKIGSTKGSDYQDHYSFSYQLSGCGNYYFRLHYENKYSEIRPISLPCLGPKITAGKQSLTIDTKTPGTLTILSPSGQKIQARTVLAYETFPLSVSPGIYIILFIDKDGNRSTQKVFIW